MVASFTRTSLALAGAIATCSASGSFAQPAKTATVGVKIQVLPFAAVECPEGFNFHLYVPPKFSLFDKKGKGLELHGLLSVLRPVIPAVIPFKVRGNAVASVSAKPSQFLRIKTGAYLGKALPSRGSPLGYNIIMQFPMPAWSAADPGSWELFLASYLSGFASLPGVNGQGTRPLSSNLALRPRGTYGVLYVGSRVNWTADGKEADEGRYGGSLVLTLTPVNN